MSHLACSHRADGNCSDPNVTAAFLIQWFDDCPFPADAQFTYTTSCRYKYTALSAMYVLIGVDTVQDHAYVCSDLDNAGAFYVHKHILRDLDSYSDA